MIITPNVNDSVADGWGGAHKEVRGSIAPYLFAPVAALKGVHVMIPAPDVDDPIGDGGRGRQHSIRSV